MEEKVIEVRKGRKMKEKVIELKKMEEVEKGSRGE